MHNAEVKDHPPTVEVKSVHSSAKNVPQKNQSTSDEKDNKSIAAEWIDVQRKGRKTAVKRNVVESAALSSELKSETESLILSLLSESFVPEPHKGGSEIKSYRKGLQGKKIDYKKMNSDSKDSLTNLDWNRSNKPPVIHLD